MHRTWSGGNIIAFETLCQGFEFRADLVFFQCLKLDNKKTTCNLQNVVFLLEYKLDKFAAKCG